MNIGFCDAIRILPSKPTPLPQQYDEFLRTSELCEGYGFEHIWLSEHHLAEDFWNPSPLLVLSALAQRTKNIRLGTFILLLSLHNPLKVAEEVATLDILSNGRFDFAIGAKPMDAECAAFGIDPKTAYARTYESLDFILRCFTEDEVNHDGKYYQYRNVRMTTKPVQKPYPPVYMAAIGPQSTERTAKLGLNLCSALHNPNWLEYPNLLKKFGHEPKNVRVINGPIFIHLAESREKALDEAAEGMHWAIDFYVRRGVPFPLAPMPDFRKPENFIAYGLPIAAGTPDDALRTLSAYKDMPLDELVLSFRHPGLAHSAVERSLRMFVKELLPEIHGWGKTSPELSKLDGR